ncbi:CpaF family protein [Grimontia hollisae]|uniref:Type II/IV secretion system ATP hydrolase TadA/VirB11/CpaF TadA subfamily n=2 Tax=Grimontia hollisae TaxID=673 RepID=D0I9B1_GRIHO|nr:CpaF family protein [Grimontia hollisae]AMG29407.1 CpaF family protein [Grimontia hollisae]EEY72026.1 type II/IV secretion system ATP hydrolase TadA/VirB11/CpaF TadA subfamily [Grimontia hollisae CIP 101886]MDF2184570.1 CpaF family protein [Grimontia hollisae]STO77547.1 Type IV secretion system protein virB11 [Grimontia hollisae]STO98532.1 Type IV secretion system protein virB11 [Grimontia hollisae]
MQGSRDTYRAFREKIFDAIDAETISSLSKAELKNQLIQAINVLADQDNTPVPSTLRNQFVGMMYDELRGLGPIQTLIEDDSISDIMVNGPKDIFIERHGLVEKSSVTFIDEAQLVTVAKRIAAAVGRRVDESAPLCDARLSDGSRVNIVLPPIAIDGASISIRKFKKQSIGFPELIEFGAMSPEVAKLMMIASRCRLNIVISGGTGSGKTTMMNALSQYISEKERIVTIEDAAELRLQQPHVVRLETRPAGIEGTGEVNQRHLVINSLRMRPDRIVIGECRGPETFEMLQAMNTGHDGSMTTLHANNPRDAISRIESMVMMATSSLPLEAIRRTVVSAIDIIIQISRLHDGSRKVMSISEVVGMEGQSVVMEEIFRFEQKGLSDSGKVLGDFVTSGLMQRSALYEKARYFGLDTELNSIFSGRLS